MRLWFPLIGMERIPTPAMRGLSYGQIFMGRYPDLHLAWYSANPMSDRMQFFFDNTSIVLRIFHLKIKNSNLRTSHGKLRWKPMFALDEHLNSWISEFFHHVHNVFQHSTISSTFCLSQIVDSWIYTNPSMFIFFPHVFHHFHLFSITFPMVFTIFPFFPSLFPWFSPFSPFFHHFFPCVPPFSHCFHHFFHGFHHFTLFSHHFSHVFHHFPNFSITFSMVFTIVPFFPSLFPMCSIIFPFLPSFIPWFSPFFHCKAGLFPAFATEARQERAHHLVPPHLGGHQDGGGATVVALVGVHLVAAAGVITWIIIINNYR